MLLLTLIILSSIPVLGKELRIEFDEGSSPQRIDIVVLGGVEYVLVGEIASVFDLGKFWNGVKKSVTLKQADREATLAVDSKEARVNGKRVVLASSPKLFKDMMAVPLGDFTLKVLTPLLANTSLELSERSGLLSVAKGVRLKGLRFHSYDDHTRLVLEFFEEPKVYQVSQTSAGVIVITVLGATHDSARVLEIDDGVIDKVSLTRNPDQMVAAVSLALPNLNYRSFLLAAPPRVVIDVHRSVNGNGELPSSLSREEAPASIQGPNGLGGAPPDSLRVKTVIIDPGHGGKDSGAKGRNVLEKNIVLDIAKRLRDEIKKNKLDVRVVMTRETDEYVPLEERARIAHENKGDGEAIFISIHANDSRRRNISGFETYFFDVEARGEGAAEMVETENSFVSFEDNGSKEMSILSKILDDMEWTAHIQQSSYLAEVIQGEMDRKVEGNNRGVKQGPFFVLRNVSLPRVLVEVGFLSNSWEEKNLRKPQHRQKIAGSLFQSIKRYKQEIERRNGFIQEGL